ncbi:MAG: fasciclin domain-containing protein [Bacteroidia bacterium]|nr:fasciclin domain-containing protein [Bacteroidia bacterium]
MMSVRYYFTRLMLGMGLLLGLLAGCGEKEPLLPTMHAMLQDTTYDQMRRGLVHAGMYEDLDGEFYYTLFIPTNAALAAWVAEQGYTQIEEVPADKLRILLNYHIQLSKIFARDFRTTFVVSSALSKSSRQMVFYIENRSGKYILNGKSTVIKTDIEAHDGVFHMIDKTLDLPTVNTLLEANPALSTYARAINQAGLRDDLESGTNYTVWAPSNTAWTTFFDERLDVAELSDLGPERTERIVRGLTNDQELYYNSLKNNISNETYKTLLDGSDLEITNQGYIVLNDSIFALLLDIQAYNGVIHIVDKVLDFP